MGCSSFVYEHAGSMYFIVVVRCCRGLSRGEGRIMCDGALHWPRQSRWNAVFSACTAKNQLLDTTSRLDSTKFTFTSKCTRPPWSWANQWQWTLIFITSFQQIYITNRIFFVGIIQLFLIFFWALLNGFDTWVYF